MNQATYAHLANAVILLHLLFVVFAGLGGLLALRYAWIKWLHIPTFLWAAYIEITGGICPLTPVENWLRYLSEEPMYVGSFMDQYVWNLLYPAELTRATQIGLGSGLMLFNVGIYAILLKRHRRPSRPERDPLTKKYKAH